MKPSLFSSPAVFWAIAEPEGEGACDAGRVEADEHAASEPASKNDETNLFICRERGYG